MCAAKSTDIDSEFFQQMVETVGVGVGIYDDEGAYIYVNKAYADIFGVTPVELIGMPIWDIAPEIEQERFRRYWHSFEAGNTKTAETIHEYGGVSVPVETITTRLAIDGTPYHFGTIKDISERKAREQALERQNVRLDAFTSIVSHDLRNPLNIAQGYLGLLKEDYDRDEIALIDNALDRMNNLVSELLSLAKSGETISDIEPTVIGDVATRAWNTVETADATYEMTAPEMQIMADSSRLQQLLENLFRNAVEHAGGGVTVTVGKTDDGFYVADDGVGIPRAQLKEVLKAGYTTAMDGTGFGLNIVSQIVGAHDWEIHIIESAEGGTRFEIANVEYMTE